MLDVIPTLEIERITNLFGNFGWTLEKQEITESDIVLTIKKEKGSSLKEKPSMPG